MAASRDYEILFGTSRARSSGCVSFRCAPIGRGKCGQSNPQKIMRCLTSSEIRKWLAGQGMHHQPHDCGVPVAGDFRLPEECQTRQELADGFFDLLIKDGNKLVEIMPAPQRSPDEWDQIRDFQTSCDEVRPAISTPGYLFKSADRANFRGMLSKLMGFPSGWTFYVYSAPSHTTLLVDGDRMEIWSLKRGLRNEFSRLLPSRRAA